jgi:hypothetical protein
MISHALVTLYPSIGLTYGSPRSRNGLVWTTTD